MKIFISISILGMVTAGIYGLCDMSNDVLNGTMINYHESEQQMDDQTAQQSASVVDNGKPQALATLSSGIVAVKEKQQPVSLSQITYSDYSRGGFEERPVNYLSDLTVSLKEDSVALHQQQLAAAAQESPKLIQSPAVVNPKESENVKEDKMDIIYQYYSRAPLKKKKAIVVKADKSGMDSTKVNLAKGGL